MTSLRIIFRWLVGPFITLIIGRACLEAAHQFGWHPDVWLAESIVATPTEFESELVLWMLAAFLGAVLWALGDYFLYRRKTNSNEDNLFPRRLDATQRQKLCNAVKTLATEQSRVDLVYFPAQFRPMVEDLGHVFLLAGWKTNPTLVPRDGPHNHRYVSGVEVRGPNKHLVGAVCKALRDVGVWDTRAEVIEAADDTPSRQHIIFITIGHIDYGLEAKTKR
jgi:hypothetical protein